MDKAHFTVHDELWSESADYRYGRLSLYVPHYMCAFITHKDGKAQEYNIKLAKRQMMNKLIEELMGTEDWFEENKD
jgi:hypothetical protein